MEEVQLEATQGTDWWARVDSMGWRVDDEVCGEVSMERR